MTDRRTWLAFGVAVVATIFAALLPQPGGIDGDQAASARLFAAVTTAAIVGVVTFPAVFRGTSWRRQAWVVAAVLALVAGGLTFAAAGAARRACSARYDGRTVIVGTEWTPIGASYASANPGLSRDELLFDSAGAASRIWTEPSIERCRTIVSGTYALWVPLLAIGLFGAIQSAAASPLPVRAAKPVTRLAPGAVQPPEAPRYDVFISYRHGGDDTDFARQLLQALERAGYTAAIDERDFSANASFLHEMERCIRQSRFTLALISSRYLGSGNCEEEATICKVLDMGDRRRRLIPIMIESVPQPAWLFGIVGIDCTRPDPLVDPFDKLTATLGPPGSGGRAASEG